MGNLYGSTIRSPEILGGYTGSVLKTQKVRRSANCASKRPTTFIIASRSKGGSMLQENSKRLCHLSSLSPTRIIADNIRSTLISIELCFPQLFLGTERSEDLVNRTEACACKRVSGVHEFVVRILSDSSGMTWDAPKFRCKTKGLPLHLMVYHIFYENKR